MLKELKIELIYLGNNYSLTVFPEHCNYDSFIKTIQKKLNIDKGIKLMVVDTESTESSYQFINEQSIDSIISAKYKESLMIFVNDIEVGEDNDDLEKLDDIYIDNDLKDDSFDDELKNEKSERKYNSVNRISNNDEVQNNSDTNDDEYNKDFLNKESDKIITNHSLEREIDSDLNGNDNLIMKSKSNPMGQVALKYKDNNDQSSSLFFKQESFDNESCSLCGIALEYCKFVCCVCDNKTLCSKCEDIHGHPSLKFKTHFLSSINDYFFYARIHEEIKYPPANIESAKQSYDIAIAPKEIEFTMRLNKTLNVPFTITNNSKIAVSPSIFTLLIKNAEKIKINYDQSMLNIPKLSSVTVYLRIESGAKMSLEEIGLEIYSTTAKLKDKAVTSVLKIEVNEDKEEEDLNEIFKMNDALKLLSKKKKETVNYIIKEGLSVKSPEDIVKILTKSDWNTEKALDDLTSCI